MSEKLRIFPSHINFYNYVHQFLPLLNVKESVSRSRYSFKYDDKVIGCTGLVSQLDEMNKLLEKELFLLRISKVSGKLRYKIFVDGKVEEDLLDSITQEVVEVVDVREEEEETKTPEETQEDPEVVEPLSEDVPVEKKKVDWGWIESLGDDKDSKLSLDVYAEEEFGIKLKRNMKMKNMLAVFKEELAKK